MKGISDLGCCVILVIVMISNREMVEAFGSSIMKNEIKKEILQLITQHDGKWYWYQIDRYLSISHPEMPGSYIDEIKALKEQGLIEERKYSSSEFTRYWMTDEGRARLQ
ncbi:MULTISPECIES: hypothetical protein [unclassified Microcoleus]|uniref:hypothetical protein n=2 Tax=unclassified Microcoleus TaxID=2642155 RepID=UPI0025FB4B0E|nr:MULTISPECIES: hypothetical protein [unclassified Microcoleus]